jgi:hypothetical protein
MAPMEKNKCNLTFDTQKKKHWPTWNLIRQHLFINQWHEINKNFPKDNNDMMQCKMCNQFS